MHQRTVLKWTLANARGSLFLKLGNLKEKSIMLEKVTPLHPSLISQAQPGGVPITAGSNFEIGFDPRFPGTSSGRSCTLIKSFTSSISDPEGCFCCFLPILHCAHRALCWPHCTQCVLRWPLQVSLELPCKISGCKNRQRTFKLTEFKVGLSLQNICHLPVILALRKLTQEEGYTVRPCLS